MILSEIQKELDAESSKQIFYQQRRVNKHETHYTNLNKTLHKHESNEDQNMYNPKQKRYTHIFYFKTSTYLDTRCFTLSVWRRPQEMYTISMKTATSQIVIVKSQWSAYHHFYQHENVVWLSTTIFRFGSSTMRSKFATALQLQLPDVYCISLQAYINDNKVPLLIALKIIKSQKLILNVCSNVVHSDK